MVNKISTVLRFICLITFSLLFSCDFSGSRIASQKQILIMKFDPDLNDAASLSTTSHGMVTGLNIWFYMDDSVDRSALIPTIVHNGGMVKANEIRTGPIVVSGQTALDFSTANNPTRLFVIAENTSNRKYECYFVNDPSLLPRISVPSGTRNNELFYLSGGSFTMGSSVLGGDAVPEHSVQLSPYFMSQYEISNSEFAEVMNWAWEGGLISVDQALGDVFISFAGKDWLLFSYVSLDSQLLFIDGTGIRVEQGYEDYPVVHVSWHGAMLFCYFLNLIEGLDNPWNPYTGNYDIRDNGFRLPTESEWEYAARRDQDGAVAAGNLISRADTLTDDDYCLHSGNSSFLLTARGGLNPNRMGIYDMSGSVAEWVYDGYGAYSTIALINPIGADSTAAVFRGGSYRTEASDCATSLRKSLNKRLDSVDIGFRVVRSSFEGSN